MTAFGHINREYLNWHKSFDLLQGPDKYNLNDINLEINDKILDQYIERTSKWNFHLF